VRRVQRILVAVLASVAAALGLTSAAMACSPPFNPTIRALGPQQVVVVGTIGERVPGGRLFHVQRAYNGPVVATPIVIAFKEGEPLGDCSYPVAAGQALIIAPERDVDGHLSANLATLQAPPDSDLGRTYIAEAIQLFGPGVVPPPGAAIPSLPPTETPVAAMSEVLPIVVPLVAGSTLLFAGVILLQRRRPGAGASRR
jgi:hypothetical protein